MSAERAVTFASGGNTLFGIAHSAARASDTGIVILVGGPQYRVGSHRMFVQMARALARSGHPVLRFDFAGMGDSDGTFPGFERLDGDVAAAIDCFTALEPSVSRVALLGLCDGATAAALYAATDRRVRGLILLNPWVHTEQRQAKAYLWHYYPKRLVQADFWRSLMQGNVAVGASVTDLLRKLRSAASRRTEPSLSSANYVERMRRALSEFDGRISIVASEKDFTASEFVDLWTTDPRWKKLHGAVDFLELAGADHTLSSMRDMRRFCEAVHGWLTGSPDR